MDQSTEIIDLIKAVNDSIDSDSSVFDEEIPINLVPKVNAVLKTFGGQTTFTFALQGLQKYCDSKSEFPLDLCVTYLVLLAQGDLEDLTDTDQAYDTIIRQICICLVPLQGPWVWSGDDSTLSPERWRSQQIFLQTAGYLFWLLNKVYKHASPSLTKLLISSVVYYLPEDYPWTNISLALSAATIISDDSSTIHDVLVQLLSDTVKPAFVKSSSHPSVSAAGRKKFQSDQVTGPRRIPVDDDDDDSHDLSVAPWSRSTQYVISLYETCLKQSTDSELRSNWPFIVPSVLNIVDDVNPCIKKKGCDFIIIITQSINGKFFNNTGLGQVFWDALIPCLSYLPPGLAASKAAPLHQAAISAFISLAQKRESTSLSGRAKMLSQIFSDGIIKGMAHSGQNVKMASSILTSLSELVQEVQSYSLVHFQALTKIFSAILSDPFAPAYKPLIIQACDVYQLLVSYCWPQVPFYKYDLLKAAILCWKKLEEEECIDFESKQAKQSLKSLVNMIMALCPNDDNIRDTHALTDLDFSLKPLLEN